MWMLKLTGSGQLDPGLRFEQGGAEGCGGQGQFFGAAIEGSNRSIEETKKKDLIPSGYD